MKLEPEQVRAAEASLRSLYHLLARLRRAAEREEDNELVSTCRFGQSDVLHVQAMLNTEASWVRREVMPEW